MVERREAVSNCEGGMKMSFRMATRGRNTRQGRGYDKQPCAAGLCMRSTTDFLLLDPTMAGTHEGRVEARQKRYEVVQGHAGMGFYSPLKLSSRGATSRG